MIMTDSEIILCSGIKMDKNYENVLSYNEEQMVNLCRQNAIYTGTNYKIVGVRDNIINVSARYEDCIYANYIAYKNKKYGNKWFFGWVTDVKLLNPATTEITFQIDVFSTWYSRFNLNQVFIEREHVSDDTIGLHTIPENLELGEYITQTNNNSDPDYLNEMFYLAETWLVAGVSEMGLGSGFTVPDDQKIYSGINSGLRYLVFKNGLNLDKYIRNTEKNLSSSNIYCVFIIPKALVNIPDSSFTTVPVSSDIPYSFEFAYMPDSNYATEIGNVSIQKSQFLDNNYVPVNKKLLTFPYCYFNVTNNVGTTKDYHYELFNGNTCDFKIFGSIGVGCSIKMYPLDYAFKGASTVTTDNKLHGIDASKLPTCGWISDSFTNWLTQNSVNIALSTAKDIINVGGSLLTGNIGGAVTGFSSIAGTMATIYEHSLQPASAKGGVNQGDLVYSRRQTFNIYKMSIKRENAIIIDKYLSRFGYRVNEVKTPNLNSRSKFNFIKVGGMDELVHGNIPANALEEINSIFRKGVTIFHNYNDIGNYTISNPIV